MKKVVALSILTALCVAVFAGCTCCCKSSTSSAFATVKTDFCPTCR